MARKNATALFEVEARAFIYQARSKIINLKNLKELLRVKTHMVKRQTQTARVNQFSKPGGFATGSTS